VCPQKKKERSDFCVFSLSTHKCVDICESGYCKYFKRILDIFHIIHVNKNMFYFYWYQIYSHSFTIVEICLTFHSNVLWLDFMNQRLLNLSFRWEKLWIIEFMGNIFNWPCGIFIRFFLPLFWWMEINYLNCCWNSYHNGSCMEISPEDVIKNVWLNAKEMNFACSNVLWFDFQIVWNFKF
jgi:hypothetical protein